MKTNPPLRRISVTTTIDAEDAVSELLASIFGISSSSYFDLEKQTCLVSVFIQQKKFIWPDERRKISAGLERIASFGLPIGPAKIEMSRVKRQDWAESWKQHFQPIEIGKTLLIKPSWIKKKPAKNQKVVILDPGLSFGTGQHPTTFFCLAKIARRRNAQMAQSFLDIGTGSGILAIAAAKLGYEPVHAFDFDAGCVRVAAENLRKNRVADKIKLTRGDVSKLPLKPARQYDLVCANLISNLLIAERRRIVNRVKPDGTLVLAGILAAEFSEVEQAFAELKLKLIERRVENEWCSGAFCFV